MDIAIVGARETGVELSARLHEFSHLFAAYGLGEVIPSHVKVNIIETNNRLLPGLPEKPSYATKVELDKLNVSVMTNERVIEVTD